MSLVRMLVPLQLATGRQNAARSASPRRYDRVAAVLHAHAYWNRHCCDGYVAVSKQGTPPYREVEPGNEFQKAGLAEEEFTVGTNGRVISWKELDDCSHFTSCCIGRPCDARRIRTSRPAPKAADAPRIYAGGLDVKSDENVGTPWFYGISGAPRLVKFLRQPHIGEMTAERLKPGDPALSRAVDQLQAGDVIALHGARDYSHVLLHDGKKRVYAHTACRRRREWDAWVDVLYSCIHIFDELKSG